MGSSNVCTTYERIIPFYTTPSIRSAERCKTRFKIVCPPSVLHIYIYYALDGVESDCTHVFLGCCLSTAAPLLLYRTRKSNDARAALGAHQQLNLPYGQAEESQKNKRT